MLHRILPALLVLFAALSLAISARVLATNPDTIEGTVITAGAGRLTMQDQDGKKIHELDVAEDVKVTRDGMEARLENLMTGDWAKIMTEKRLPNQNVVVTIDARSIK